MARTKWIDRSCVCHRTQGFVASAHVVLVTEQKSSNPSLSDRIADSNPSYPQNLALPGWIAGHPDIIRIVSQSLLETSDR